MTGVVRWTFNDPVTSELHVFTVNPSEGGTPSIQKGIVMQNTSAPDGKGIVFQGRDQIQQPIFKGHIFQQQELTDFQYWASKNRQIYLTDDLGRQFTIWPIEVQFTRVRSAIYDWKHTYEFKYLLIDWL